VFNVRRHILRAARTEFTERGYAGATFEQIGMRVGLTRTAVNHHFSSKQVLYRAVLAQSEAWIADAGKRRRRYGETTLLAELSALLTNAVALEARHPSTAALTMSSVLQAYRHPQFDTPKSLAAIRTHLTATVQRAVQRGELNVDTDVASLVAMLTAVLCGVGFAASVGSHHDLEVVTDQMSRLLAGTLWHIHPHRQPPDSRLDGRRG
jgi:TetR/AcrR family transcriptional repressor of uid operon